MKFSIVKRYKIFFAITITFLIIGIGSMLFKGFNLGIDFTGGSIMDLEFKNPVTVSQVREVLKEKNLGNAIIQLESSDSNAKSSKGVLIRTGVISDEQSALSDCFQDDILSAPIYTRPSDYKGWKVPEILLSGNEAKIRQWEFDQAMERTKRLRPDLLEE